MINQNMLSFVGIPVHQDLTEIFKKSDIVSVFDCLKRYILLYCCLISAKRLTAH